MIGDGRRRYFELRCLAFVRRLWSHTRVVGLSGAVSGKAYSVVEMREVIAIPVGVQNRLSWGVAVNSQRLRGGRRGRTSKRRPGVQAFYQILNKPKGVKDNRSSTKEKSRGASSPFPISPTGNSSLKRVGNELRGRGTARSNKDMKA